MVETCKEYIRAGDAFQIVPSQRFSLPFKLPPLSLYRSLRRINPSPFLIFFDYGDFSIVGSSPEILVRLRDDTVTIRPLAGTMPARRHAGGGQAAGRQAAGRPEGARRAPDAARPRAQRRRPRRQDRLGEVVEQFTIEKYSHLQHISQPRRGHARGRAGRDRRAEGGLPRRHAVGRAQGARDGDHRRARAGAPRHLCRLRRLLRRQRLDGHLHPAAHGAGEGQHDVRPGGRRRRGQFRPRGGVPGERPEGARPGPRGRRGGALREPPNVGNTRR